MKQLVLSDGTTVDAEFTSKGKLALTVWVSDTKRFLGLDVDIKD